MPDSSPHSELTRFGALRLALADLGAAPDGLAFGYVADIEEQFETLRQALENIAHDPYPAAPNYAAQIVARNALQQVSTPATKCEKCLHDAHELAGNDGDSDAIRRDAIRHALELAEAQPKPGEKGYTYEDPPGQIVEIVLEADSNTDGERS